MTLSKGRVTGHEVLLAPVVTIDVVPSDALAKSALHFGQPFLTGEVFARLEVRL